MENLLFDCDTINSPNHGTYFGLFNWYI